MSETQSVSPERSKPSVDHLSSDPLVGMSRDEELAWYACYVDLVVPESNIQQVGFHRMEKRMDREAFEQFVRSRQEELHGEI